MCRHSISPPYSWRYGKHKKEKRKRFWGEKEEDAGTGGGNRTAKYRAKYEQQQSRALASPDAVVVVYSIISHSFLISPLSFRFSRLLIYIYLFCCLKKIKKSFRLAPVLFLSGHPPLGQRLRGKDISACFLRVLFPYIGSPPSCFSLSISLTQKLHFRISYTQQREKKQKSAGLFDFFSWYFKESISSSSSPAVAHRPRFILLWYQTAELLWCVLLLLARCGSK